MVELNSSGARRLDDAICRLAVDNHPSEACRRGCRGATPPSGHDVERIISLCRALLFPGFFEDKNLTVSAGNYGIGVEVNELMELLAGQIAAALCFEGEGGAVVPKAEEIALEFIELLPEMRRVLHTDAEATFLADPAAQSSREIIYCYPGLRATCNHRIAHTLQHLGVPVLPRMISESAHRETGIDIHPGATIGESFVIDHGTGIVIGATAILGNHVTIYQGVTLGARNFVTDDNNNPVKGLPRHPILGNNVIVYSNASILGRITVGDGAVIGGNVWLTHDVAPGERIVQATAGTKRP
ncbi:MAG: serine acetyltransferase [Clostridium sp.]|nr:serine acetyltransferase [Clostridium sp.]